jgi:hypothetical protein
LVLALGCLCFLSHSLTHVCKVRRPLTFNHYVYGLRTTNHGRTMITDRLRLHRRNACAAIR